MIRSAGTVRRFRPDARCDEALYLEFRTNDLAGYQQRLRSAGVPEFGHPGGAHAYCSAPGGQVFRLLDLAYEGP